MKRATRRAFLRGMGAAISLPWLPSLTARAETVAPDRLAVFFIPNGMKPSLWSNEPESGPSIFDALGDTAGHADVFFGLDNTPASLDPDWEAHAGNARSLLTAASPSEQDASLSKTVDQHIADHIAGDTVWPSLALGSEPQRPCMLHDCDPKAHISWRGAGTPVGKQVDIRGVFEGLFGAADGTASSARRAMRRSVLDSVVDHAARFRARADSVDRVRLDGFLHGVREVEKRVERMERAGVCPNDFDALRERDDTEHIEAMLDLITLAFSCDRTRVVSYMLSNVQSRRDFGFLGYPVGHHDLSHHVEWHEAHQKVAEWHLGLFAGFLRRLRDTTTPSGTLLDETYVLFASSMGDGNGHTPMKLPVILAGRDRSGQRHVLPDGTPLANLYVSLMQAYGLPASSFGINSTGSLLNLG